ncbi:glycosyltransferase family 2 protein [Streptomyces sp. NPDC127072]|uniref:glycosyltransferase family 2 protein n=1 Tax=Streptomyces sp. NPDC127072 TaxID=3347129 RepID=UPI0036502801
MSVVVPCRDEAPVLPAFHAVLLSDLAGIELEWEIIYVDDGSRDGTLEILRAFAAQDSRVNCLPLGRRGGKDAAMAAGLSQTVGNCTVFVDADLQHPTALLGPMVALYAHGYEQVVARQRRSGRSDSVARRVGSRAFYLLVRVLCGVELVEGTGDFRLISRQVASVALARPEQHGYLRGLFSGLQLRTAYVDYNWRPRAAGRSAWSVARLICYGLRGLATCWCNSLRPSFAARVTLTTAAGFLSGGLKAASVPGEAVMRRLVPGSTPESLMTAAGGGQDSDRPA